MIGTHSKGKRSQVEVCIDLFVAETRYVPDEARPVRDATALSWPLERLTTTIRAPHAWRAWAVGPRSWFVDGRLTSPSPVADQPTLTLTFRDHDARASAAGVWRRTAPGRWEPQQILAWRALTGEWH